MVCTLAWDRADRTSCFTLQVNLLLYHRLKPEQLDLCFAQAVCYPAVMSPYPKRNLWGEEIIRHAQAAAGAQEAAGAAEAPQVQSAWCFWNWFYQSDIII